MGPGSQYLTCQPWLCQGLSALPKPHVSDILPAWCLETDEDKGRNGVVLVHPAASRWQREAIPMVIHAYLGLSLSNVPKECLDRAVTVAGSAEGSRFREARVLLGLGHSSWEEIKGQIYKLGVHQAFLWDCEEDRWTGSCHPGARTFQNGCSLSQRQHDQHFSDPSAQHSTRHKDVFMYSSTPSPQSQ